MTYFWAALEVAFRPPGNDSALRDLSIEDIGFLKRFIYMGASAACFHLSFANVAITPVDGHLSAFCLPREGAELQKCQRILDARELL